MWALSKSLNLDIDLPIWDPRETSSAEAAEVQRIRDMQANIRRYMGSRPLKSITSQDMGTFLSANYPQTWGDQIECYSTALNSMDQEVRI